MDMKAILLIGVPQSGLGASGAAPECVAGAPIASLDTLGKPIMQRAAEQLVASGVSAVAIIANDEAGGSGVARANMPREITYTPVPLAQVWRECEGTFNDFTEAGAEVVIVWRMGAYAELDVDDLVQFHLDQRGRVTPVFDANGRNLDIFVISASRRNDAAFLFRHQLGETRMPSIEYKFSGYLNPLRSGADLRRLTVDALQLKNSIKPMGSEIRPGVWVGQGARIQRGARVLAPAYIGAYAKVCHSAVITRCSAIERHCEIDCGTVVENSNVLPFSYVGAGLDVVEAVVGYRKLVPLRRDVEVEITDPRLIAMASEHAPVRAMASVAGLLAFLPRQILRGFAGSHSEPAKSLPEAVQSPSAALHEPTALQPAAESTQFPNNMVVARRYGNE